METNVDNVIPPDVQADLAEVCRMIPLGGVKDPELIRRIDERARRIQEEIRRTHGELDVAVDLIRETRDEE